MVISADIKCYHCGHVSGQLVGDPSQPVKISAFHPSAMWSDKSLRPGETLRCFRCGGPVYLDDVQMVKQRPVKLEDEEEEMTGRRRRSSAALLDRKAS